jgi:uncharacterized protein YcfJ
MKTIKSTTDIKWLTTCVVLFSLIFSSMTYAGGRHHKSVHWAKVTRVEPITHRVERRIPEEQCWNQQVKYYDGYHNSHNSRYRKQHRCEVTYRVDYQEEILAYRVWFRYKGQEYKTRMNHKPGKRIKVSVSVEPI